MALLANLALFFVLFLPLTYLVGWPFDYYVGRYMTPEEAPRVFNWIVMGWKLLLPGVLFVPVAHVALAIARRTLGEPDRQRLRRLVVVVVPLGFLAVHLALWGTAVLGVPLLVSVLIPGAVYGLIARLPMRRGGRG